MAGFGSMMPDAMAPEAYETWQDREAREGLALQQADAAKKRSWADTGRDVLSAPYRLVKGLASPMTTAETPGFGTLVPGAFNPMNETASMPRSNPIGNTVGNLGAGLGEAVVSGATLPGDVAAGKVPMVDAEGRTSPELIHRAFDTAAMAGGASVAGTAGLAEDSGRAGAAVAAAQRRPSGFGQLAQPINPLENADQLKELANQRRAKGWSVGKPAEGHDFKRPDPEPGSLEWHDAVASAKAEAEKPAAESHLMTPEDHAFVAGGGFFSDTGKPGAAVAAVQHVPHPAIRQAFHDEMGPQAGQAAYESYIAEHGPSAAPETAATVPAPRGDDPGGTGGGDAGLRQAQAEAARRAGTGAPLEGLPTKAMKIGDEHFVPGPIASVRDVAEKYMADRPKSAYYKAPEKYHELDPEHSAAIAKAFDEMKHAPNDPATKASYQALIDETKAQYQAVKASGLKIEPIPEGMADPYAKNPRLGAKDVADNNHLWFFPTDQGFGSGHGLKGKHPMLQKTGEKIGDRELVANDLFRVVHDYFGHLKEGFGFRAGGEDNAWRSHASMYSDLARPAMTTETRGQNSWLNYGPYGEKNRKSSATDTVYADQKVGLMPEWTMRDRGTPEPKIVYHGSPHAFSNVDTSKIGMGQGAQTFGKGFYGAEEPKIAKKYRDELSSNMRFEKDGESVPWHHVADEMVRAVQDSRAGASPNMRYHPDQAGSIVHDITTMMESGKSIAWIRKNYDGPPGHEKAWEAALLAAEPYKYNKSSGHIYQLAIDQPPEKFLDWDAKFSDQHPEVQAATRPYLEERLASQKAARENIREKANGGNPSYQRMMRDQTPIIPLEDLRGHEIHKLVGLPAKDQEEAFTTAAERLKAAGVPGIRYLDQYSRGRPNNRTRNFVTFDAPRVLKRYAIPGAVGFGALASPPDDL